MAHYPHLSRRFSELKVISFCSGSRFTAVNLRPIMTDIPPAETSKLRRETMAKRKRILHAAICCDRVWCYYGEDFVFV